MLLEGRLEDEMYKKLNQKYKDQLLVKKIVKNEERINEIKIETLVGFMKAFLGNLADAWVKAKTLRQKKALVGSIFINGIVFENGAYRTAELSPIFRSY